MSWGSSSRLVFRSHRPNGVTASSRVSLYMPLSFIVADDDRDGLDVGPMSFRVGVDLHRPKLEAAEGLHVEPEPLLAEEDRPRGVPLDAKRRVREQRSDEDQADRGTDDIECALHHERRARKPRGRNADESEALEQVHAGAGPHEIEQPWNDVDDDVVVAHRSDDGHRLGIGLVRERDDDPVNAMLRDELLEPVQPAENKDVVCLRPAGPRLGVDETEQVEAILGMLSDLAGDELPDVACTEHDRSHGVRARTAAQRASHRAGCRDERDREQPEDDEPLRLRRGEPCQPRQHLEEPRSERDDDEDADELVHGRVVGALLVPLVVALQLREHQPHRQRQEEEEDLAARLDAIGRRHGLEAERRDGECECDPQCVRRYERTPNEPPTTAVCLSALAMARKLGVEDSSRVCDGASADLVGLKDSHAPPCPPDSPDRFLGRATGLPRERCRASLSQTTWVAPLWEGAETRRGDS